MSTCRLVPSVFVLVVLVAGAAQAATIDVRQTAVHGVSIVSAELVPEPESSSEILVIRLKNDGAASGQPVHLTMTTHDAGGEPKRGGSTRIEVEAPIGNEQVVTRQVERSLEASDRLTLELKDIAAEVSGAGSGIAASSGTCATCEWGVHHADVLCGTGNIKSFSCSCGNGSCSFECGPGGQ